jgi:DNA-binding IclR family transcriptional regulator
MSRQPHLRAVPFSRSTAPVAPIYENTIEDKQFATTLARGLEILRCFTPERPVLGNKDLVLRTGLPKATISRFTYTLVRLGYLRPVPDQQKYQLGSAVLSLGFPLLATMYVRQLARPHMFELANELGASIAMGIRDRLNIVYVETSRSQSMFAPPYTEIGFAHPIAATSMGRAYLAGCSPQTRKTLINEISVKEPALWTKYRASVERSQKDFLRLGFCMSFDGFRPNINGVAVPLRRPVEGELIVLNCAVYADRCSHADVETRIGPRLVALGRHIENLLHG